MIGPDVFDGNATKAAEEVSPPRPVLVRVADVQPEAVDWLWPGRLPLGKVTVLDGDPGLGKSTLTLDVAARLTTGSPMPDGHRLDGPSGAVILSAEDGIGDTIRPRLEAAGADLGRVFVLDAIADPDGPPRPPSLPGDMAAVAEAVALAGASLVVIDPLMAFLHAAVNSYRDQDVRRALHPLKVLAEQTGAAVVLVRHLNKSAGTTAVYRGGGSIGIIGAARLGLLVAADPDDPERRILAVAKSNLAVIPPSLAYRLVTDEAHGVARIAWEGTSAHTADALLVNPASDDERAEQDEARDFLLDYLADGRQRATDAKKAAKAAGIAERTLDRARHRAGVTSQREGFGPGSVCWWEIHTRQPDGHNRHTRQPSDSGDYGDCGPGRGDYGGGGGSLPPGLVDLPRDQVCACRSCHATTVTADDAGPRCQRCATARLLDAFPGSTIEMNGAGERQP
ncbi:MAG: AAA family ATPase [Actinomycetota bacterium]|nr:AAA family ATPase [Actinomycetota bacterium]